MIGALLALNYPTFEVIVVGEGLAAADALITAWELEPERCSTAPRSRRRRFG
jgi:hypothetical protein